MSVFGVGQGDDQVTLVLRGERVPLRDAISAAYNATGDDLLVASATSLELYRKLLETGGRLVATHSAEDSVKFHTVLHLPWLDAYSVVVKRTQGNIEHRIVSADLKTSLVTHCIAQNGEFHASLANESRKELITADSNGGLKIWTIRALSSTRKDGGLKGIQRIQVWADSSRVFPILRLCCDGQRIVAGTRSRIYILDAVTCTILAKLSFGSAATLAHVQVSGDGENVFVVLSDNLSKTMRYSCRVQKGKAMKLRLADERWSDGDSIAMCSGWNSLEQLTTRSVCVLDVRGRLKVVEFGHRQHDGFSATEATLRLPSDPLLEQNHALYGVFRRENREFVFAVWSTGYCLVEAISSRSSGRKAVVSSTTMQMKTVESNDTSMLSLYQKDPSSRVLLVDAVSPGSGVRGEIRIPEAHEDKPGEVVNVVDTAVTQTAVVVLWANGCAESYSLQDNRISTIAAPLTPPAQACALSLAHDRQRYYAALGDSCGFIRIVNCDAGALNHENYAKQVHSDRVSRMNFVDCSEASGSTLLLLLSIAQSGEVKLWSITISHTQLPMTWDLVACFRTQASSVSAATFEFPSFVFCGFEGGSIECWNMSANESIASHQRNYRHLTVIKRPMHSIDLHLAPIKFIAVEPGGGTMIMSNNLAVADPFAWVYSVDGDGVLLTWCFSTKYFFPYRRLAVSHPARSIYVISSESGAQINALVGNCINMLDEVTVRDRDAVYAKLRGTVGWQSTNGNGKNDEKLVKHSKETQPVNGTNHSSRSKSRVAGSPVRIDIAMLDAEKDSTAKRVNTPSVVTGTRHIDDDRQLDAVKHNGSHKSELTDAENIGQAHELSTTLPPSILVSPSTASLAQTTESSVLDVTSSTSLGIVHTHPLTSLPYCNSLPSSFQTAKPRVYRNKCNPRDTLARQTKCAVIMTSGAPDDLDTENHIDPVSMDLDLSIPGNVSAKRGRGKATVVSMKELEDDSLFLLDFRPETRARPVPVFDDHIAPQPKPIELSLHYMSWEGLSERQRHMELTVACRSRIVRELGYEEGIEIPNVKDFEIGRHNESELIVHSFSRWFLQTHLHRQRIREKFLSEELVFAAADSIVLEELKGKGQSPPSEQSIGDLTSVEWQKFATWYSLGRTTMMQIHAREQTQLRERLEQRSHYLENRLSATELADLELHTAQAAASSEYLELLKNCGVYIFEHFELPRPLGHDDPMSWDNTAQENRQREVALALLDPLVQVAAMQSDIELPDMSSVVLDGFDLLSAAASFVQWWKSIDNQHRKAFLEREVHEAIADTSIVEHIRQEQQDFDEQFGTGDMEYFTDVYFKGTTARVTFLKNKLSALKRDKRRANMAAYSKFPAPLMFALLPVPVVQTFSFPWESPPEPVVEAISTDGISSDSALVEADAQMGDAAAAEQEDDSEDMKRRLEEEQARIESELGSMAIEDELSRALSSLPGYDSDVEEVDDKAVSKPRRADFSRSYFFGNLPIHFGFISSSGWGGSGSGVDNGDEEIEEAERLEREREQQRLLEQQEAERLLEAERLAERLRVEKERDEKWLQTRRARQVELKKLLIHQAELEDQRRRDLEMQRANNELLTMAKEEAVQREHLHALEEERQRMIREDLLAQRERKFRREAAAKAMRNVLMEMTSMAAEDVRSRDYQIELARQQEEDDERREYLKDLYSPFEPYFPSSSSPGEEFLPSIQRRLLTLEQRAKPRPQTTYSVPFSEAIVYDELERDPYIARDSRKFQMLMGIPVRHSRQHKSTLIPSEQAIIERQQQQRHIHDPAEEERIEPAAPRPSRSRQGRKLDRRPKFLPELPKGSPVEGMRIELSEFNELWPTNEQIRPTTTNQNQHPKQRREVPVAASAQSSTSSVPFFRGNMIVRGTSQSRARDYSYS